MDSERKANKITAAYSDLLAALHVLKIDVNSFSEILNDLHQIVDRMDIVVDPRAHVESLQDQHEQLVQMAQQFSERIANLTDAQRRQHGSALAQLTIRVEALRLKLIKAIENGPADNSQDVAMDFESKPLPQITGDDVTLVVEQSIDQAIAAEKESEQSQMQVDQEPVNSDAIETPVPVDGNQAPMQLENEQQKVEEPTKTNLVVHVENGEVIKLAAEKAVQPAAAPVKIEPTTKKLSQPMVNNAIAKAMQASSSFSFDTLLQYNALSIELLAIPQVVEPTTPESIRKLREFITNFIKSCDEKRVGTVHFAPVLIATIISALSPTLYSAWQNQMMTGEATLTSVRTFLTNQEAKLLDKKYVASKFLFARAIKEAKELLRTPPKVEVKSEVVNFENPTPGGSNVKKERKPPANFELPSHSMQRGRSETANGGAKSRESSTSSRSGAKKNDSKKLKCFRCNGPHALFKCKLFLGATLQQRWNYVNARRICVLCLQSYHQPLECTHGECKNHANHPQDDSVHNSTLCAISEDRKQAL